MDLNPTSLTYALSIAALLAATTWFIDWGAARNGHWSARKRRFVRRFMIVLSIAATLFVYRSDSQLRGTTLFEVAGPWEENGARLWPLKVEHPGIEHTLMVYPFVRGLESAERPVTLRVRLGVPGKPALIEATTIHETTSKSGRNASGYTWTSTQFPFTPSEAGPHQLIVESVDGILPPLIHLRISDPEKRDGQRAPGY